MKKILLGITILSTLVGCMSMKNYADTAFYAKNTSSKPISFEAGIMKNSMSFGRYEVKNSFQVSPNDSILIIRTNFKKEYDNPQHMFSTFTIFPGDENTKYSDAQNPKNWKKYLKGDLVIYTFTLNE
ncbi:MAG: hypothetical protein CSA38_03130 [Flavobacteriales bacterium]|nr:MAG: hypothetical protein CSA38_03130 [Flavobacteriales bacterium]